MWTVLLIFSLDLEISGVAVQRIHQSSEKWWLLLGLLSKNYFEAVLTTFCCYDSVPTLLRQFRRSLQIKRLSQMLLVCYSLLNSQNIPINNSDKRLITKAPPTQLKKLQKLHRKRNNNWPMVSFIHNGSEITTWMGYSFKTESTKSKATFLRLEYLF